MWQSWQPEVIVTDVAAASASPAEVLVLFAAKEAFRQAADPNAFPEQIAELGLKPWEAKKLYALDEDERKGILDRARDDGVKVDSIKIQRFKGLGEMNPEQLWETALCPDTRRLLKVRIEDRDKTLALFNMLMSKRESEARCAWMEEKGDQVETDV